MTARSMKPAPAKARPAAANSRSPTGLLRDEGNTMRQPHGKIAAE
jgi:hypothetical protein